MIFEEAGFLPAESCNVITVRVDGNVEVSFPADTDLSVIAKFIRKIGKDGWTDEDHLQWRQHYSKVMIEKSTED